MEGTTSPGTLMTLSFFEGFPKNEVDILADLFKVEEYPAEYIVFPEDDPAVYISFILEGRLAIQHDLPGLGPQILVTLAKGNMYGWSAFVPPHVHTAAARTMSPMKALIAEGKELRRTAMELPDLGLRFSMKINEVLATRIRATSLQLMNLRQMPAQGEGSY